MPLLRGQRGTDWPGEVFIQISESGVSRSIRTHRWKYAVTAPGLDGNAAPGSNAYDESHLYDLYTDPYELRNLIGSVTHRELCDRLQERLVQDGRSR